MIYNVYTPSSFNPSKLLPIVITFSPNGEGSRILNQMKASAEKYDWILVSCDKLRTGMKGLILEKQMEDEVLNDILKIYLTIKIKYT